LHVQILITPLWSRLCSYKQRQFSGSGGLSRGYGVWSAMSTQAQCLLTTTEWSNAPTLIAILEILNNWYELIKAHDNLPDTLFH